MKSYREVVAPYDPKKDKFFTVPCGCLYLVIVNQGKSNLVVNEYTELQPGQSYPYPIIPGYCIHQDIKIQIINDANKALETKVRIRMAIENN